MPTELSSNSARQNEGHRNDRLSSCYQRGVHLMKVEKNHDYAHVMFAECVVQEPANLTFVEAMLQNLREMIPEHKKKSAFRRSRGGSRALKQLLAHKDWQVVFRTGAELLKADPWDVTTLRAMAEACEGLHHNEVELVYLKQALDADPKSVEVNRHCAQSLARMGQFDQAIACWHRIETLKGRNEEAARMICQLSAEKLKYPSGRPPTTQSANATHTDATDEQRSAEVPAPSSSSRQLLERAIAADPHDLSNYLSLVELLVESGELDAAGRMLGRAVIACGEQPALAEQLDRLRGMRMEQELVAEEVRLAAQRKQERKPFRMPWLELLLVAAAMGLIFQFVPGSAAAAARLLDARRWSRVTWFVVNLHVLLILMAIRFRHELFAKRRKA